MRINFERMNFEVQCYHDIIKKKGFLIKDVPFSDVDKSIRNMDGPRSPRYGTTYGDNEEFMDRYRCECGYTIGSQFEGDICVRCKKPVEHRDVDIEYTGWLNFGKYKVINPIWYPRLQSALSKKVLENIISNENIITSQGIIRKHNEDITVKKSQLKYHNVGLLEFYLHYEEILLYYRQKRKQKADLIDNLLENKSLVWTSKFPIYSTALRPQSITTESFYFSSVDRHINPLTNITINLRKASPIEIPLYLYQAQTRLNELWNINFSLIDGKSGWIRGSILGGEFNYSSRTVIVLDPTLRMDEIDVPYKAFIETYKGHIIKRIKKDKGWTITKAANYLASKFNYDDYVYSIIEKILEEEEIKQIINRNPTLTLGSILEMRIRRVKKDPKDLTMAIPSAILPGLKVSSLKH